jgi:hypothetical protein
VLLGEVESGRDHLIQQGVGMTAIRSGPWKYLPEGIVRERGGVGRFIQTSVQRGGALYYLPEDPEERNNVASKYPGVAERLRKLLVEQTGADATGGKRRNELGGAVSR